MIDEGQDIMACADAGQWESWLADHHDRSSGVWLKIAKQGSRKTSVTIAEALDVALCYGWIDSQRRGLDEDHYLQRYSPRRPGSAWSQVNVDKVEALIAAGRMREPGRAQIAAAKADGRWDARTSRSATPPSPTIWRLRWHATTARASASSSSTGRSGTRCSCVS